MPTIKLDLEFCSGLNARWFPKILLLLLEFTRELFGPTDSCPLITPRFGLSWEALLPLPPKFELLPLFWNITDVGVRLLRFPLLPLPMTESGRFAPNDEAAADTHTKIRHGGLTVHRILTAGIAGIQKKATVATAIVAGLVRVSRN